MGELHNFIRQYPRLFVLSGAGVSTDSGIPGYRDAEGRWKRTPPVLLHDFLSDQSVRQRYWLRSMVGWRIVAGAHPNIAHHGLARLAAAGRLQQLVTQNVDGLHQSAGSNDSQLQGPEFALFVNDPRLLPRAFARYLEGQIRKAEPYPGLPITLTLRPRGQK